MAEPRERFGDIRDVLVALPHGDPYGGMSYVREDLFTVRYDLIAKLDPQPTSVFEFGALVGYFLVTALDAAPSIGRVGWVDNESHSPGSNAQCRANVERYLDESERSEIRWFTTRDDVTDDEYDLVAVDSDHSYDGCLADLRAAHRLNPRTIMLDDWVAGSHGDDIQRATSTFLEEHPNAHGYGYAYDLAEYVTVNGLAVLTRKEHA